MEEAPRDRGVARPEAPQANGVSGGGGGSGDVAARGPPLSGTSYWLDFWLMILFDLVLFVFVYLLP